MSASVLTNNSAMIALQTLRSTNKNLAEVNSQISTGKKIASAKDSAAVFAITKVMESDVAGFKSISESLSLGSATLGVASNAAEQVGSLLEEIKGRLISSRESNVDRTQLSNEITSLTTQINSIVTAAQFNGLNLLDGSTTTFNVLSSLDRSGATVTPTNISVNTTNTDLSTSSGTAVNAVFDTTQVGANTDLSGFGASLDPTDTLDIEFDSAVAPTAGGVYSVTLNGQTATYTAVTGDTNNEVAYGLRDAIADLGISGVTSAVTPQAVPGTNDVILTVTNGGTVDLAISGEVTSAGSGGLAGLTGLAAAAAAGASDADLATMETLIQTSTTAQATLGTAQTRVDIQSDFMSSLIDSFKTGIGALVDADLEEASARLTALQTQQQLGIQALSIANQAPQNILSLFR